MPYLGLAYNVGDPTNTFVKPGFGVNNVPANCLYIFADSNSNICQAPPPPAIPPGSAINKACVGGAVVTVTKVFTDVP